MHDECVGPSRCSSCWLFILLNNNNRLLLGFHLSGVTLTNVCAAFVDVRWSQKFKLILISNLGVNTQLKFAHSVSVWSFSGAALIVYIDLFNAKSFYFVIFVCNFTWKTANLEVWRCRFYTSFRNI